MRLVAALFVALSPVIAVAQTDEWVRDDMTDDSLVLLQTGNLAREPSTAGIFPGAPERGSQWVVSKGDGPAYVVYFLPGPIHEVEIDTHRLAGAAGDFTLAVSTDGKFYEPINAGSVLLDSSFGWDYRLMASDQIPDNATHLLVQFPNGSTAHRLSEVWIRYTWDDALVNRFLPTPAATTPAQGEFSLQSDADLQLLLDQLMAPPRNDPGPSVDPLDTFAHTELAGSPEPQTSFAAPPTFENVPALAQPESLPVDDEEKEEEIIETTEPAFVVGDTTQSETVEAKDSAEDNVEPNELAVADESMPTIAAQDLLAENEASEAKPDPVTEVAIDDSAVASADTVAEDASVHLDSPVAAEATAETVEPIEVAAGSVVTPSGMTEMDVAESSFSDAADGNVPTVESSPGVEEPTELTASLPAGTAIEPEASQLVVSEIDVAEFSPNTDIHLALEAAAAPNDTSESIEIEPLAITAAEPDVPAMEEAVSIASAETLLPENPAAASDVADIDVAEFSPDVDTATALETVVASIEPGDPIESEPLAIAAAEPEHAVTGETQASTELAPIFEEAEPVATELGAIPDPGPALSSQSVSEEPTPATPEVTAIAVAEFETPAEAASELIVPAIAAPAEEPGPSFDHSRLAPAEADQPATRAVEVAMPEPTPPESAPTPTMTAETDPAIAANAPVIEQFDEPAPIADSQPEVAIAELPAETPAHVDVIDPAVFADPEVEVEAAETSPEIIAIPSTTYVATEEPEQVWRLPPFDLPIMSASQARGDAPSAQEEPVSSLTESTTIAMQESPLADATEHSSHSFAVAPNPAAPTDIHQSDASLVESKVAAPQSSQAAPPDSGPILIAAAVEPAEDAPVSEISEDVEEDRKPTMKVRRVGPRSKSRDIYSVRR